MDTATLNGVIGAVAALLSAIATGLAAYAAWKAPRSAAELSEKLRREGDAASERRRLKLYVFTTLMQERAFIASSESVRALNLIDVVFHNSTSVREAWAELFQSFTLTNGIPEHVKDERLRRLLRTIAMDIGISDDLRADDFARTYYPNAIAQEEQIRHMEREANLRRLQGQLSPTSNAATTQEATDRWPPPPSP